MVRQPMIDYLSGDISKLGLDMAFFYDNQCLNRIFRCALFW